ncbi:MAG: cyclic nucleotide-binding domain-containing protein [Verrucomicrobiota bacterium]
MDQPTLLGTASLRLSPHCKVAAYTSDIRIVKCQPTRAYLNMSNLHWDALRAFGDGGLSVPQTLFKLISDRRCPPLREFYELVVKAADSGILEVIGQRPPAADPATEWTQKLPPAWIGRLVVVASITAVAGMVMNPFELPGSAVHLLVGWLLVCLTTSLGYALAACVARHLGAEIYHPRFVWKTLLPHFRADLDDAVMGGREAEFTVGVARLAPSLVSLAITPFFDPGISLLLFCDLLFNLSPFWWSPGLMMLHARYSTPHLDSFRRFRFEPNKVIWQALRLRFKGTDVRFLQRHALYTIGWLGMVLLAASLPLRASALDLWQAYREAGGLHFTALALLTLFGLMITGALATSVWLAGRAVWRWVGNVRRHLRRPKTVDLSRESIAATLADSLLFQNLQSADREALIDHLEAEEHEPKSMVVREGDAGDLLYLVMSGRVEVLRDTPTGRLERVAELTSGDVFGEMALLESGRRTRSVRTRSKAVFLTLDRDVFQNLVLARLTRREVIDIIQKVAFLHRVPLSSNWSPHAMYSFARRSALESFKDGDLLIRENDDNQYFFVLYEGELAVRVKNKEVARLHTGDFFGEISALQNSVATATIAALGPVRTLVMSKREFLQFLVNDFCIGLQFEAISSKRLGQPVFPLKGRSFDVLR